MYFYFVVEVVWCSFLIRIHFMYVLDFVRSSFLKTHTNLHPYAWFSNRIYQNGRKNSSKKKSMETRTNKQFKWSMNETKQTMCTVFGWNAITVFVEQHKNLSDKNRLRLKLRFRHLWHKIQQLAYHSWIQRICIQMREVHKRIAPPNDQKQINKLEVLLERALKHFPIYTFRSVFNLHI